MSDSHEEQLRSRVNTQVEFYFGGITQAEKQQVCAEALALATLFFQRGGRYLYDHDKASVREMARALHRQYDTPVAAVEVRIDQFLESLKVAVWAVLAGPTAADPTAGDQIALVAATDVAKKADEPRRWIVWNEDKTEGFVTTDEQLAYEVRKCATTNLYYQEGNGLPTVATAFCEKWGEGNCTSELLIRLPE